MGGFFGTISKGACITDLFYGTDYNSHLGTRRGGMATYDKEEGFTRSIHNLENSYFRTKFEPGLPKFKGKAGIGIISDTDAQPIVINSHLGKFAIGTVAKINNLDELEKACIIDALEASDGQIARAAAALGLTQRILGLRLKKYGISYKDFRHKKQADA